jgi:hypothetical protein
VTRHATFWVSHLVSQVRCGGSFLLSTGAWTSPGCIETRQGQKHVSSPLACSVFRYSRCRDRNGLTNHPVRPDAFTNSNHVLTRIQHSDSHRADSDNLLGIHNAHNKRGRTCGPLMPTSESARPSHSFSLTDAWEPDRFYDHLRDHTDLRSQIEHTRLLK